MHKKRIVTTFFAGSLLGLCSGLAAAGVPGDLDNDDCVGQSDLGILLASYLFDGGGDIDGDGDTDQADLGLLLSMFGICGPEIAGSLIGQYPFYNTPVAFNQGQQVFGAVDPTRFPALVGKTVRYYVVAHKTFAQWSSNPTLTDVSGDGPNTVVINPGTIQANIVLIDNGTLNGTTGTATSIPYDVVIDVDNNGALSAGDLIDGLGGKAGLYVCRDLVANGPLAVSSIAYGTASTATQQLTFYPTGIASMGQLPLVCISHGNGHNYQWYQFLQSHLASYGYIVMSHFNNTGPGIEPATDTTVQATNHILLNQATIGGGVLNGHIDKNRIMWIGHSRGGESVVRGYDRLFDAYPGMPAGVTEYTKDNIKLVSSIAPTDFLGTANSHPHDVDYHLLYGAADGDVSGIPGNPIADSFDLFERAEGNRAATYLHGADHNDFNCCGFEDYAGPVALKIGRMEAQRIQKATTLCLLRWYLDGDPAAADNLKRQYENFKFIGSNYISPDPGFTTAPVVVDRQFKQRADKFVIDDYQTQASLNVASSGAIVSFTVGNVTEGLARDNNSSFDFVATDPFNGCTWGRTTDTMRAVVFDWTAASFYDFDIGNLPAASRDFSSYDCLSLRAAQGTRHPNTVNEMVDLNFTVTLRDSFGNSSSINISAYGGGIEDPFQRTGSGTGTGWQNEAETILIPLRHFTHNTPLLDLSDIDGIRLNFGGASGTTTGRLVLDDVEVVRD